MAALDGLFEQLGAAIAPAPCANPLCRRNGRRWRALLGGIEEPVRFNGSLYCSLDCLEWAARAAFCRLMSAARPRKPLQHRLPLGLLMLSKGIVDGEKLKAALKAQRESGSGRVGEWLCRLGAVSEDQVTVALGIQWGCPVFPLERHPTFVECASFVPLPILESTRMVLVHFLPLSKHLYVAFADGIDHSVLASLERMFECRTEPSLTSDSALRWALEEIRRLPRPPEISIKGAVDPLEMARILRRRVANERAREVRVTACEELLWARVGVASRVTNLLYEVGKATA